MLAEISLVDGNYDRPVKVWPSHDEMAALLARDTAA